jgi:hypothetical protein
MDSVLRLEMIAAACHAAWYGYTIHVLNETADPWSEASDDQKNALYHWVHFWDALPDNTDFDSLCSATHLAWVNYMKRHGWAQGLEDPLARKHPGLVSYDELSTAQQAKYKMLVTTYLTMRALVPPER